MEDVKRVSASVKYERGDVGVGRIFLKKMKKFVTKESNELSFKRDCD